VALVVNKTLEGERPFSDAFLFNDIVQHHSLSLKEVNYVAPLYIYPKDGDLNQSIRLNFRRKYYNKFLAVGELTPGRTEMDDPLLLLRAKGGNRPNEIKILDYIYGVLHCPAYRETYAEFLRIDFPRIPLPPSPEAFATVSAKGEALRRLHLMEDTSIGDTPYPFHGDGESMVDKPRFDDGKVWINASQYFEGVPAIAWDFPIGGYQPAQKWLNDRKDRALSYDDVRHYQKIIKILAETDRIMREIELPLDGSARVE
jgi:predicted helicase